MLTIPSGAAGTALVARYEAVHPNDARKKAIASWGIKPELDTTPIAAAAAAIAPVAKSPEVVTAKSEPLAATPTPTPTPAPAKAAAATPPPLPKPSPTPEPAKAPVAAAPVAAPVAAAPQPDPAAQKAKADKELAQSDLYDQYLGQIRKQVLRRIEYPRRASKEGVEGLVMLRVIVNREGNVASSEVVQSAHDLLDAAAESAVQKAAPFPKPPEQLEGNQFAILIPVVFKLTQ
jgi:protein TonB